jgi:ribose transport system ATP-binding protein
VQELSFKQKGAECVARLEMKAISKSFSGNKVLDKVELAVDGGKVISLLGENGAGKSTLMKILTGEYQKDEGQILIDGKPVEIGKVDDAKALGIGMIHQELNLFWNLSIAENFLIGNENRFKKAGLADYKELNRKVREVLERVNLNRDPNTRIDELGIGEQQLVEIGKALQNDVRFLVMDEPTAALTESETDRLFKIVASLKEKGVGIIYISHRMEELFKIADQITVLRDGKFIATRDVNTASENELISLMVGRTVENRYPKEASQPGKELLKLQGLTANGVKSASLVVSEGEIVGLGGLMGAGRTELARAVVGAEKITSGTVYWKEKAGRFKTPKQAIENGIAFVTEDRKTQGLVLPFSVRENLALPTLRKRSKFGLVRIASEKAYAAETVKQLKVKTTSTELPVESLSGGNQQKVVIGKWLAQNPDLLILDEPTRGVDVGAKQEIYVLMNSLKKAGKGILMISSDLPELLGMCDRVYVMHEGSIQGELQGEQMNEESFMILATGGDQS